MGAPASLPRRRLVPQHQRVSGDAREPAPRLTRAYFDHSGDNPWLLESSQTIYDNGRFRLLEDRVVQPDGAEGVYSYVELHRPVAAIIPVSDDAPDPSVYLVRQWRYPWRHNSWEVPAGHCEPGEDPLVTARRELAEEVGLSADVWIPLPPVHSSAMLQGLFHLYLARGLSPTRSAARDATEYDLVSQAVPLHEAVQAALDGRITHAATIVGLLRVARLLSL